MGVNDDWCYIRGAQTLAATGHVVYHAYESATLGWQLYIGAAFIKLFGFSFSTTRTSLLPIALSTVLLFHRVLLRSGVRLGLSTIGALTLATSPLFVPLSFSFMSDIPGLFTLLLCAYLCLRALQADTNRSALLLLTAACLSNVGLGTVRQIAWLGTIAMVPASLWLLRKRIQVVRVGLPVWGLSLLLIHSTIHWFNRQPYSLPETLVPRALPFNTARLLIENSFDSIMTIAMLAFPTSIGFVVFTKSLKPKQYFAPVIVLALLTLFLVLEHRHHRMAEFLLPMMRNYVTDQGTMLFNLPEVYGQRGVLLSSPVRLIITMVTALVNLIAVFSMIGGNELSPKARRSTKDLTFFGLSFTCLYILLLIPRTIYFSLFDRYLLPLLPIALIFLLRALQSRVSDLIQYRAILVTQATAVAIVACYSTAVTHDAFAADRARLEAIQLLRTQGIPRTAITAGFEFDGTTQLDSRGYINYSGVPAPRGAYVPPSPFPSPDDPRYYDKIFVSSVKPGYLIGYQPRTIGQPARISPISYRTWLRGETQYIYFQTLYAGQ